MLQTEAPNKLAGSVLREQLRANPPLKNGGKDIAAGDSDNPLAIGRDEKFTDDRLPEVLPQQCRDLGAALKRGP